jgi:hypothetical protein
MQGDNLMRKHSLAGLVAALLVLAGPAFAQSPPADNLAAARELITVMRSAETFKAILPALAANLKPAIVQGRAEIERDYDAIMPVLLEGLSAKVGEIVDQIAGVYARTFTAQELREISAFYRAPTGQKFVEKQPVIMQESLAIGQKFGQAVAGELQGRMVEELRKRGHKI